jgi:TPR repeat
MSFRISKRPQEFHYLYDIIRLSCCYPKIYKTAKELGVTPSGLPAIRAGRRPSAAATSVMPDRGTGTPHTPHPRIPRIALLDPARAASIDWIRDVSSGPPVKRETLITALVFLAFGFLAGYIYKAQAGHGAISVQAGGEAAASAAGDSEATGGAAMEPGAGAAVLPPGHPAIDDGAMIQALEDQANSNPQDPAPPLKLADYLYDHGRYEQAIVWYQKALQLDPTNVSASTDLGTCYFNVGRTDDALTQFHQSLAIEPRHQPTLFNIIVVQMEGKHDYRAAADAWETLHRVNAAYPKLDELKQKLDQARSSSAH